MFEPLPSKFEFQQSEKRILDFWDQHDVFHETVRRRAGSPRFVFYEGPPTANGMPHPGHCLTRVMKDVFPRYKTMCGFLVERKGGWDTHGLPVEREVCKELGIRTKQEIEAYGVEKFNLKCIQSVFRYTREWEEMTRRLAYWVDLKDAYVTFHQSYVESVWWSLKTLFERGVLYQGHKVVWWWAQGGTALSSGEVGEGYKKVDDPSVFVKFPLVDAAESADLLHAKDDPELNDQLTALIAEYAAGKKGDAVIDFSEAKFVTSASLGRMLDLRKVVSNADGKMRLRGIHPSLRRLFAAVALDKVFEIESSEQSGDTRSNTPKKTSLLVWTTTPWTLISNHFAAVHPDLEYALVHDPETDEHLYIAAALVETIAKKVKRELRVVSTCKGVELIRSRFLPPFRESFRDAQVADFCSLLIPKDKSWGEFVFQYVTNVEYYADDRGIDRYKQALSFTDEYSYLWEVRPAEFVTVDSGTGVVHIAPPFGEDDFQLWRKIRERVFPPMPLFCAVNPDGTFNADAPERYRGRWVKECDKDIIRELRDERKTPWGTPLLYHQEVYNHDYPFCPQSPDDPLIQYARKSWFVRTSQYKDEFLKNNAAINWLPEHIKEGRFGDFLRNNVDWALSRERYWGTPLPIWQCESCGKMEAIGSFAELAGDTARGIAGKPGATDGGYWERKVAEHRGEEFPAHLRVHKPYIDEWTYECAACAGSADVPSATGNKETKVQGNKGAKEQESKGRMRRVTEVIDCWWDAGSMPFAQWGFPHATGSVEKFLERFPADFISEAIDQTRGWFYGLLAISTLLYSERAHSETRPFVAAGNTEQPSGRQIPFRISAGYPIPFKTCIVLGHIAGEDGNKMSKKLRNYKEPTYIFDTLGADAMRWYFLSAQAPWTSTRFAEAAIRDSQREFLVKLYNVLSFFTIYAKIDGFDPSKVGDIHFAAPDDPRVEKAIGRVGSAHQAGAAKTPSTQANTSPAQEHVAGNAQMVGQAHPTNPMHWRPTGQRTELDRWIVTELRNTVAFVRESMDRFENYPAAQKLNDFVDALSNWYVRRSRDRFWRSAASNDQEKFDAYHTLYGCLRVLSHLIAPFTPFFAEKMHEILRMPDDPISIHMCDYPTVEDIRFHDAALATTMNTVRDLVALGRAARTAAKLKVRQPLSLVEIILAPAIDAKAILDHAGLIAEELNVKRVELAADADKYVTYKVVPNFKAIGSKFRAQVPGIKDALGKLPDAAAARRSLLETGALSLTLSDGATVALSPEEVEIRLDAKPGWAASQGKAGVVVLSTEVSPELRDEGVVRELIHFVQAARKEQNLAYEARIALHLEGPAEFQVIVRRFEDTIKSECLVTSIVFIAPPAGTAPQEIDVEGHNVKMAIVEQR